MLEFLQREKDSLDTYARQTWHVMSGKYALTKVQGLAYQVTIGPDTVLVTSIENGKDSWKIPTVKFKALLEMFRI